MVIVATWMTAFFFAQVFQCGDNPTLFWTSSKVLAEYCGRYKEIQLGHAVSDVIVDLIILTIPIPIIWKLQMSLSQKSGLLVVSILGYMYVSKLSELTTMSELF